MNTGASGLFAARDPPNGCSPLTDWRAQWVLPVDRLAGAFPYMLQHALNAATTLAAAPVRLSSTLSTVNNSLCVRFGPLPPEPH